jgi:hypothetical protein
MKKLLSSLACIALVASASGRDAIDAAILDDILHSYIGHVPTECNTPEQTARTSFSFEWPGTNILSSWKTAFAPYEQGMFQAIMSHNDTGNRSWSMRIGTGKSYSTLIRTVRHVCIYPDSIHVLPGL